MASTPTDWPSDGIVSLSHVNPEIVHLEQLEDSVEYIMPTSQRGLRNSHIMRQRAPLACIACRSQHAKCSGESPKCNRCQIEQRDCQYPKSRRKRVSMASPSPILMNIPGRGIFESQLEEDTVQEFPETTLAIEWPDWSDSISSETMSSSADLTPTTIVESFFPISISQILDAYYEYFHRSHPIAPTKLYVNSLIQYKNTIAVPMLYAIQYIGSIYLNAPTVEEFKSSTLQHISHNALDTGPRQIYQASAMLMLAIAAYGQDELTEARKLLESAILQFTSSGMSHKDFLVHQADQELVELWKRTYWYLYVTSAQLSNIYDDHNSLWFCPTSDFPLPCEDDLDLPGAVAQKRKREWNLLDFDASEFDESPIVFSSFTYFIALVRIGRSIKDLHKLSPEQLERAATCADVRLKNWKTRLPPAKRKPVDANGEVDHIMFQAHILSLSLCIDVHTHLSRPEHQATALFHAKKVLEAAEDALGLMTLYTCTLLISPFSISHISNCTLACLPPARHKSRPNTRDYVSFILSSLQQLTPVWMIASQAAQTIRQKARRAFAARDISDFSGCTTSEFSADITQIHPT